MTPTYNKKWRQLIIKNGDSLKYKMAPTSEPLFGVPVRTLHLVNFQ